MLTVEKLRCQPKKFHAFTGLTPDEFDTLFAALDPVYQAAHEARRDHPCRRRALGAGHPFRLPGAERLLMVLVYGRVYLTQGLLGFLFGLDDSNVSREIPRIRQGLLQVLPIPMRASNLVDPPATQGRSRVRTLSELLGLHPEIEELLIDATEQPVFRPQERLARRQRYSGKHKQPTLKTQVATTPHLITHVIGEIPGCVNDNLLLQGSGLLRRIPAACRVRLDLGYEGIEARYPDCLIEKGIRGQRGHTLTLLGKLYNQMLNRLRVPVEHVIGRLKQFNVLALVYRGRWTEHESTLTAIAGLVNFVALGQLTWESAT